jgi:hypothetical protein
VKLRQLAAGFAKAREKAKDTASTDFAGCIEIVFHEGGTRDKVGETVAMVAVTFGAMIVFERRAARPIGRSVIGAATSLERLAAVCLQHAIDPVFLQPGHLEGRAKAICVVS